LKWRDAIDPLGWFWPIKGDERVMDAKERRHYRDDLDELRDISDAQTPEFVLSMVMLTVQSKHDTIQTLETKAASQIGFAGAIMAIMVALGRPGLIWAACVLGASILSNLRAMLVTEYVAPSPLIYNLIGTVKKPENKARIAIRLAEAYGRYAAQLGVEGHKKSRYVLLGTVLLVAGTFLLVALALTQRPGEISVRCPNDRCTVTVTQGADSNAQRPGRRYTKPSTGLRPGDWKRR
jgi:hypothetical protein